MSTLILKIIAIITMTIDHYGAILLNNNQILRCIGRIAFPIYGFLLVQGFNHVKNDKKRMLKYFINLTIFAFISEIIYDLVFYNKIIYIYSQNIMFSLLLYLFAMFIFEKSKDDFISKTIAILLISILTLLSYILFLDYKIPGFILVFGFYIITKLDTSKENKLLLNIIMIFVFTMIIIKQTNLIANYGSLLSIIPIILYNDKKGYNSKFIKYGFYIYYPLHLLVLYLLK